MHVESPNSTLFEKFLHQFAITYQDLLDYSTDANNYYNNGGIPAYQIQKWNKEFLKKQLILGIGHPFVDVWVPSANFDPSQIPDLGRWSVQSLTTLNDGDSVSNIDNSYAASDPLTQADSGLQPVFHTNVVNGLSALTLNGSAMTFAARSFGTGDFTIVFVAKANGGQHSFMGHTAKNSAILSGYGGCPDMFIQDDGTYGAATDVPPRPRGAWRVVTITKESGVFYCYVDGTNTSLSSATGNFSFNEIFAASVNANFSGQFAELCMASRALTESERRNLEVYFGDMYNIPINTRLSQFNLVCDGDSQTHGYGTQAGYGYPWQFERLGDYTYQVANRGTDGATFTSLEADAATDIDPHIIAGKTNVLVVWAGTNDLAGGATAAQTIAAAQTYTANRRAAGWDKIYVVTIMPRSDAGMTVTVGDYETRRAVVNAAFAADTSGTFWDDVVTLPPTLMTAGAETNTIFFNGDNLHLTRFGASIVAAKVYEKVFAFSPSYVTSNLVIKLLAEDAGADGASVTTWPGTGGSLTTWGANPAPVVDIDGMNDQPAVVFGSGSVLRNTDISVNADNTVFIVFWDTGPGGQEWNYSANAPYTYGVVSFNDAPSVNASNGTNTFNFTEDPGSDNATRPVLVSARVTGGTLQSIIDGQIQASKTTTVSSYTGCIVGGSVFNGDPFGLVSGKIAAVFVYNGYMSDEDYAAMRKALAVKYGVCYLSA